MSHQKNHLSTLHAVFCLKDSSWTILEPLLWHPAAVCHCIIYRNRRPFMAWGWSILTPEGPGKIRRLRLPAVPTARAMLGSDWPACRETPVLSPLLKRWNAGQTERLRFPGLTSAGAMLGPRRQNGDTPRLSCCFSIVETGHRAAASPAAVAMKPCRPGIGDTPGAFPLLERF